MYYHLNVEGIFLATAIAPIGWEVPKWGTKEGSSWQGCPNDIKEGLKHLGYAATTFVSMKSAKTLKTRLGKMGVDVKITEIHVVRPAKGGIEIEWEVTPDCGFGAVLEAKTESKGQIIGFNYVLDDSFLDQGGWDRLSYSVERIIESIVRQVEAAS